jgi:hypothetical protein
MNLQKLRCDVALEILENLGVRSFESEFVANSPEYLTDFTSLSVGTEYTETSSDWVRSSSSAIEGIIENDGQSFLKFRQYGYQGGRLTKTFPEPIHSIEIQLLVPDYTSDDVGIKLKSTIVTENVKITIDRNSIKVYQFDTVYNLILTVDISTSTIGDIVYISTSGANGFLNVQATGFSTETIAISSTPSIDQIEFFASEPSSYPLTLKILSATGFGDEQRNLNLSILPQLATEYIVGDILIVSVHEGSDYDGDSIAPRASGQFIPLAPTKNVGANNDGFQRFWAKTLTASEPNVYQFTRGDHNSYYDNPKCIGFIVRGALLEDLVISWADAATGANIISTTISSNSCNATQGDLVYGYAHNESNYDQMYSPIPFTDFLWYQTYPYGVTSLREALLNDDGVVRFEVLTNAFDYKILVARISSGNTPLSFMPEPEIIDPIEINQPPFQYPNTNVIIPLQIGQSVQTIIPVGTRQIAPTYPNTNVTIPSSAEGAAPQTLTTSAAPLEDLAADVLRGFDNLGYAMQRPKRLSGVAKLEDDIWRITSRILLQTSLRTRLVASEQGLLAARIKRELENPVNWWAGQDTPIVLQKIVITRRDIARIGGIALQADADGDLAVFVNYLERSTGIEVQRDGLSTLTIPFGAFDGGS